jgi:hypothetical protein
MTAQRFPNLDPQSIPVTRDALHAYARILGSWLTAYRQKRKHWWHASLRPSLNGLSTGVVHADSDFELELNLRKSMLQGQTSTGTQFNQLLFGQPAAELEEQVRDFLVSSGIDDRRAPKAHNDSEDESAFTEYSAEYAEHLAGALSSVAAAMQTFRADIREETSPIQLWPHHFVLSMIWLPGDKIHDQDPDNEEYADKQMNFGFTLGDTGIPEPYFYITAYPLAKAFSSMQMPEGTVWHSNGFNGAVLLYQTLIEKPDPTDYLLDLWNTLLSAGREHMTDKTS